MLKKNVRTCATFDAYLDVAKCSNNLVIFKYQIKKKILSYLPGPV